MCLAVPGKIVEITEESDLHRSGKVDFGGVQKDVNLSYVPEAKIDDYVIVHVGFALNVLDQEEAEEIMNDSEDSWTFRNGSTDWEVYETDKN